MTTIRFKGGYGRITQETAPEAAPAPERISTDTVSTRDELVAPRVPNAPIVQRGAGQPQPTRRPALPTTAAEKLVAVGPADTERLVGDAHRSIEVNLRGTRAPGTTPQTVVESQSGSAVTAYGAKASLAGDASGPSVTSDRQTLLLNGTVEVDEHAVSGYGGAAGGVLLAGGTIQESVGLSTNVFLLGNSGFLASGAIQKMHTTNFTLTGGGCGWIGGGTTIKAVELQNNWVKVEQSRSRSIGGLLLGGLSAGFLGVGGRLTLNHGNETVLRRWLSPEAAAPLLKSQDRGIRTFLTNRAIALGLAEPPLNYPNLADPKSFVAHDEFIGTVKGSLTGSVALATAAVIAGVHHTRSGEFELVVHHQNNAETHFKETLSAMISPKKVTHALSASIDLPLLAEFHHTVAQCDLTREGWSFEVGEPEAFQAYRRLLHGELPGTSIELAGTNPRDAAKLTALMRKERLPKGVKRLFAERARLVKATATGGGMTLPRYIPGLNWAGLSAERRTTHSYHSIGDANGTVGFAHHTVDLEQQRLRAGTRTQRLSVEGSQVVADNTLHERGVLLGAKIGVDRTGRNNRNTLVDTVNKHALTETQASRFTHKHANRKQTYAVSFECKLDEAAVTRLKYLSTQPAIVQAVGEPLRQLLIDLGNGQAPAAGSTSGATEPLARFLGQAGFAGLRDLQKLLGDRMPVAVKPASSAQTDVAAELLSLTARYNTPINPATQSKADLNKRVKMVSKAVTRASNAADDLRQDPLLEMLDPSAKAEQMQTIQADKEALQALLETDHLQSSDHRKLMAKLSQRSKKRIDPASSKDIERIPLRDAVETGVGPA